MCQRGERESPPETLGKAILVISGQSRKMYQYLEPKPEGTIFPKRSMPQEDDRAPHDTGTSMANWLEWNIQGGWRASRGRGTISVDEDRDDPESPGNRLG